MKKICLSLIFPIIFSAIPSAHADSKYPQTREEKQSEEIGSLLGGEGIVFRPSHMRNEATKNSVSSNTVNHYLWQASRQILKFIPIASIDASNGIIITDWYSTKNKSNYAFKIEVNIIGDIISPESIEVNVFERKLHNNQWYNDPNSKELAHQFENQILRKARELYINASQK